MAKLRREPRFRLECGHLSYAVAKQIMEGIPGSKVWCIPCQAWREAPKSMEPLWQ